MRVEVFRASHASGVRVIVDPNSVSRRDPSLSVASFADAEFLPAPGDHVLAVQPDDDGTEGVADAEVVEVNREHGLILLRVDWATFREVPSPLSAASGALGHMATGLLAFAAMRTSNVDWPVDAVSSSASHTRLELHYADAGSAA